MMINIRLAKVEMRATRVIMTLIVASFLLGCSGVRDQLGLSKNLPDEFTVVTKPPLIIPPNFNLRPPIEKGVLNADETGVDAQSILFAEQVAGIDSNSLDPNSNVRSSGEITILQMAGGSKADPSIRSILMSETILIEEGDRSFADGLIFWKSDDSPHQIVDAGAEAERLRENAASGLPPNVGETPTITRDDRAILEGVF